MGVENGAVPNERMMAYHRQMSHFGYPYGQHHPGADFMPFGFKSPEFVPWNVPAPPAYSPYSPGYSRFVPPNNVALERLAPSGEESIGSHEVLSKDSSSDSVAERYFNIDLSLNNHLGVVYRR